MRTVLALAVLWMVALAGCGKKTAKNAGGSDPPNTDQPARDEGNRDTPPAVTAPGGGGGGSGGIVAGGGLGIVVNPSAALGGGGGGGAVQAVRKAARRTQALNELHNLGLLIEELRDPFGKMPTKEQIVAALKGSQYANILTGINEGAYILTGTTDGGGLWAYEVDADKLGGIALIGGKATRATAEEVQRYLPRPAPAQPPTQPQPPRGGALDNTNIPPARAQAQPQAKPQAGATVTVKDMEDIKIFIHDSSLVMGRMPAKEFVYGALVQAGTPTAKLVNSGAIVLTGAQSREGVWAYEAKALEQGGMIVGPNGVETVTATELKRRLGVR
jgi:predicted small lipoprotein YifL